VTRLTHAEQLLQELGIDQPEEIDLEAIAYTLGTQVRYRPLDGCEARIIGNNESAIVTVNSRSSRTRQRFSIGHELGHWHYHRGRLLVCRPEDIGRSDWSSTSPERIADNFAADLIMPWYLFLPIAKRHPRLTFQVVRQLADIFDASPEAAAIRLIESRQYPSILVCHTQVGRKWFRSSAEVPPRWFPQADLDRDSYAFDILFGNRPDDSAPHKIGADAWFDRSEAQYYEVQEQTIRAGDCRILTLLTLSHSRMLEDR
jgi:hypothetical protein